MSGLLTTMGFLAEPNGAEAVSLVSDGMEEWVGELSVWVRLGSECCRRGRDRRESPNSLLRRGGFVR